MSRFLSFLIFIFTCIIASGQQKNIPDLSELQEADIRTFRIKSTFNDPANAGMHVEYPLQDYYHKPFLSAPAFTNSLIADVTPPSDPSNFVVHTSGTFSVYVEFDPSADPESGISYYAFAIGTAPGLTNIRYWQSLGTSTTTQSFSLSSLGITEGSVFYFSFYAVNGANLLSNTVSTPPITMNWEDYGDASNNLTIIYSGQGYDTDGTTPIAGWTPSQINTFDHFISRMLPIIKDIYGPPSKPNTITLVRNLYYSGSNIYFPNSNQIHKDDSFYPQLLTHELIHAFRDDVILAMDASWNYHPKLSGFEESFAQGASYACMNRYVQLYPNDPIVNSTSLFGSSMDWDYDFRNVSNITTEDFWSDYGGMLIYWERYELGAAAMRKMQLEDTMMYRKFNIAYYNYLNSHHQATPTRSLCVDLLSSILPVVEGIPTTDWINKQRIFDCTIQPGYKGWVRTQHYPWSEYIIFQRLHYYETFSNGSDWAHYNNNTSSWIFYNLNGSTGAGTVYDYNNSIVSQRNLIISNNPGGFGDQVLNFSTDNDVLPWPGGNASDYLLSMNLLGLYKLQFTFGSTSTIAYRVMGNQLRNTTGVFGGILHANGGHLFIDHDGFPLEPQLNLTNGAFWGSRSWASLPNILTGGKDSRPGKLTFRYFDASGNAFRTKRNIDYGSSSGNQLFLLDVNEMIPCDNGEIFSNETDDDCDGLVDEPSPVTLNLKLFIEGLYLSGGMMTPALFNSGVSIDQTKCDSIVIELHGSEVPHSLLFSTKGIIDINGNGSFVFPQATNNNSYYIVIRHRNSIETWSAMDVLFDKAEINYNFSGFN